MSSTVELFSLVSCEARVVERRSTRLLCSTLECASRHPHNPQNSREPYLTCRVIPYASLEYLLSVQQVLSTKLGTLKKGYGRV